MKKIIPFILFIIYSIVSFGQEAPIEMADKMREDGKIYVVVAVVSIVFAGIVLYLISIDSKLTKIEKELKNIENK